MRTGSTVLSPKEEGTVLLHAIIFVVVKNAFVMTDVFSVSKLSWSFILEMAQPESESC